MIYITITTIPSRSRCIVTTLIFLNLSRRTFDPWPSNQPSTATPLYPTQISQVADELFKARFLASVKPYNPLCHNFDCDPSYKSVLTPFYLA